MMYVYFGLGTNLGDKEHNLRLAVRKIEERVGKVVSLSALYYCSVGLFFRSIHVSEYGGLRGNASSPLSVLHLTQEMGARDRAYA